MQCSGAGEEAQCSAVAQHCGAGEEAALCKRPLGRGLGLVTDGGARYLGPISPQPSGALGADDGTTITGSLGSIQATVRCTSGHCSTNSGSVPTAATSRDIQPVCRHTGHCVPAMSTGPPACSSSTGLPCWSTGLLLVDLYATGCPRKFATPRFFSKCLLLDTPLIFLSVHYWIPPTQNYSKCQAIFLGDSLTLRKIRGVANFLGHPVVYWCTGVL